MTNTSKSLIPDLAVVATDSENPDDSWSIEVKKVATLKFCNLTFDLDGDRAKCINEDDGTVRDFPILALLTAMETFLPVMRTHYDEWRDRKLRGYQAIRTLIDEGKVVNASPEAIEDAKDKFGIDLTSPEKPKS